MKPEELAKMFWDSLERQRVEQKVYPVNGLAAPFSDCHPFTREMWTKAAEEVLTAQSKERVVKAVLEEGEKPLLHKEHEGAYEHKGQTYKWRTSEHSGNAWIMNTVWLLVEEWESPPKRNPSVAVVALSRGQFDGMTVNQFVNSILNTYVPWMVTYFHVLNEYTTNAATKEKVYGIRLGGLDFTGKTCLCETLVWTADTPRGEDGLDHHLLCPADKVKGEGQQDGV